MRRLRRWMGTCLIGLALLLSVTSAALWVRSQVCCDTWQLGFRRCTWEAQTTRAGRVDLMFSRFDPAPTPTFPPPPSPGPDVDVEPVPAIDYFHWSSPHSTSANAYDATDHRALGFGIGSAPGERWVQVPLGLASLLALVPAAVLVTRRYRRRFIKPPGACRSCGYDLRATPARCPECGLATPSAPS